MATLSPALSLRANLSAAKLRQDNPNWTEVMIDDYLAIGAGTQQTTDQVNQNTAAISQNAEDIAQNKTDIAQNKADIAQNAADIAQLEQDTLDTFTFAAYGGLQLNLPPSAFPDIDATWQTIKRLETLRKT
jgi:methionine synthase I (cobalamin-dependent)